MQVAGAIGFITFGYIADAIGRRGAFLLSFIGCAATVPLFVSVRDPNLLLAVGALVSYFGSAYYSGFAPTFAELFPTSIRATAQGVMYNGGRAMSAFAPAMVGFAAGVYGISSALALTAGFFLLAALIVFFFLPETKATELT